ncbi:hypothetical protein DEO72_LG1g2535 [Vigna unguiculata]|uniref:Secreted protein n=1 Tax=Vigna unguiculata TaxID=3917 RepID=A0A4D6KUH7_VIGUN|nr:hypothetical protein DEO72_LG1g2535 [Vigna unguiculata]
MAALLCSDCLLWLLPHSQVPPLSCCAPLVRVEAPSSYFQVQTVADTDRLAQASLPRPGETCRGSPRAFCTSGRPSDQSVFLSEQTTCPGERGLA